MHLNIFINSRFPLKFMTEISHTLPELSSQKKNQCNSCVNRDGFFFWGTVTPEQERALCVLCPALHCWSSWLQNWEMMQYTACPPRKLPASDAVWTIMPATAKIEGLAIFSTVLWKSTLLAERDMRVCHSTQSWVKKQIKKCLKRTSLQKLKLAFPDSIGLSFEILFC